MTNNNDRSHEVDSGIDKIRDIIFGDEIKVWEKKYSQLKKECEDLKNKLSELDKKFTESEKIVSRDIKSSADQQQQIQAVIEKMKAEFDKRIKELGEAKVDKSQIGQAFIEWGMRVKQDVVK